jgi:hypothetical protein
MKNLTAPIVAASLIGALVLASERVATPAAPLGQYSVSATTVMDAKTKLTWQRSTSPSTLALPGAQTYCSGLGTGWRIPTLKELATLVDVSVAPPGPMIDATAFPGTMAALTWSFSPSFDTPGQTWMLDFSTGGVGTDLPAQLHWVRCVH